MIYVNSCRETPPDHMTVVLLMLINNSEASERVGVNGGVPYVLLLICVAHKLKKLLRATSGNVSFSALFPLQFSS